MSLRARLVALCLLSAGCSAQDSDKPVANPQPSPAPAAVVIPVPTAGPAPVAAAQTTPPAPVQPPAGPLYVCVSESAGGQQRTTIDLPPSVETLCRKSPEMGPCQYEREACRRSGGRVFTADGTEITLQTEAEYDRHVMRIRMKSN